MSQGEEPNVPLIAALEGGLEKQKITQISQISGYEGRLWEIAMLLRFGFANHFSVLDYTDLSMIASKAIKDSGPHLIPVEPLSERAVPVALIYGANASGKSTLCSAIATMCSHVTNSFAQSKPNSEIPRNEFALSKRGAEETSRFDCDMLINGVRYHYGFEATDHEFTQEWLYAFPEGSRRTLYQRENGKVSFGKYLRGRNKIIEEFMRKNSLYLSVAAQHAHPQLTPIFDFFESGIVTVSAGVNVDRVQQSVGDHLDERIVEILRLADTGIVEVKVERKAPDAERLEIFSKITSALSAIADDFPEIPPPSEITSVKFLHASDEGEPIALSFESESRGTIRLIALLTRAMEALDRGSALVVDELDVSLHTLLSLELVSLFSNEKTNPNGAQLIATTHDTNVLCSKFLRRDQIWFCEKDRGGKTSFYPLTDIRTRNTDNLEKGYLEGRFGAIPFIGPLGKLLAKEV